jgi:hypothetical protein
MGAAVPGRSPPQPRLITEADKNSARATFVPFSI